MTEITAEQAAEVLEKEKQERAEEFARELEKLQQRLNCQLRYYPVYTNDGRTVVRAEVEAL